MTSRGGVIVASDRPSTKIQTTLGAFDFVLEEIEGLAPVRQIQTDTVSGTK